MTKTTAKAVTMALIMTWSGLAAAQSSVTLYGVIDYGINFVNDAQTPSSGANGRTGGKQWNMSSSIMRGDRIGFKGSEDLGGGYKALFVLENGFDVGTGKFQQGGTFFGRQAYVGLGNRYGSLTFGRQYDEMVDYLGLLQGSPGVGAFGDHPGDVDNTGNDWRVNNSVKFTSQSYNGFQFSALYGFGGTAGNFANNSVRSFGASYAYGGLVVAAAYLNVNNPNQSFYGNNQNSSATGNNLGPVTGVTSNPIIAGFASARTLETYGAAARYSTGGLLFGLQYTNIKFKDLNNPESGSLALTNPLGYSGSTHFNNYNAYATYYVTPALSLNISYDFLIGGRIDNKGQASYNMLNAAVQYFLSKRTLVYVVASGQKASGTDSTGQSAVASMEAVTPSNSNRQIVVRVGISHSF
ncbi:porin [Paraburkholderia sp.]|uniref:porin n=1 Tax=Paraburkholderia sp. TaxID=1926495 RepID=UPI003C7EA3E2